MPCRFSSEAQRKKFYALKQKGEVTQEQIDKREKNTPKNIPKRKKASVNTAFLDISSLANVRYPELEYLCRKYYL